MAEANLQLVLPDLPKGLSEVLGDALGEKQGLFRIAPDTSRQFRRLKLPVDEPHDVGFQGFLDVVRGIEHQPDSLDGDDGLDEQNEIRRNLNLINPQKFQKLGQYRAYLEAVFSQTRVGVDEEKGIVAETPPVKRAEGSADDQEVTDEAIQIPFDNGG